MLNAVVIPFPKRAAFDALQPLLAQGPAKIIIFPGVRYGRIPEEEDLFAIATAPLKTPYSA